MVQLRDKVLIRPLFRNRLVPLTANIFKDLLVIRNRIGIRFCFLANNTVLRVLDMMRSSRGAVERANRLAAIEELGTSTPDISQMLGPKGGVPKTKDKLQLLATSLGITPVGTVMELQNRCREALGTTRAQQNAAPPSLTQPIAPPTAVGAGPLQLTGSAAAASYSGVTSSPQATAATMADLQAQIAALQHSATEQTVLAAQSDAIVSLQRRRPTVVDLTEGITDLTNDETMGTMGDFSDEEAWLHASS